MNPCKDPFLNLRADGRIAVLSCSVAETSRSTKQFLSELSKLVKSSTTKQPLVYTTDRSVSVVYRAAVEDVALRDPFSLRPLFSDIGRRIADVNARIEFAATCDAVELPDGGVWNDRTPETGYRHDLPIFDTEAMAQALVDLVDRATAAGTIIEKQPSATPAPVVRKAELDIGVDPGAWDQSDPRRNDPALIAEVRRRRSELMGGRASDQIDDEALAAVRYRAAQRG